MDGPISTSEAAGPAQQATSIPFRSPSVGPPEKVPPVLEGDRSRSSVQDEESLPGKIRRKPAARDRKAEAGGPAKTQSPPYVVELRPGQAEDSGKGTQTGSSRGAAASSLESGTDKDREPPPLPGGSSTPAPREVLAEALAAAKARWAEVNQEALEANALPDQPLPDSPHGAATTEGRDITDTHFSSRVPDLAAPSAKDSPDVEMSRGFHHRVTILYENLATSLSNPHPTKPLIDVFV
jgi:hypothetical protein